MSDSNLRSNGDVFTIAGDRLAVTVARPGSAVQQGARFDLTGHVIEVELDGRHRFCAPEGFDELRGSGGLGLCNELQDVTGAMYGGAAPGGKFPKLGVGLLTRESDEEYSFMTHYEKEIYPIDVDVTGNTALFTVHPRQCRGYAAQLVKKLTVNGNRLIISYSMENTGGKALDLLEYNHNFVCVDGHPIGPDYRLQLPFGVDVKTDPDVLVMNGNEVAWKGVPPEAFFCKSGEVNAPGPWRWELIHEPSGVGMRERGDFSVHHLALWGMAHVVSPEVFVHIVLESGQSVEWKREYEFFTV